MQFADYANNLTRLGVSFLVVFSIIEEMVAFHDAVVYTVWLADVSLCA